MKKVFFFALMVLVLFASCDKKKPDTPKAQSDFVTVNVGMEYADEDPALRMSLSETADGRLSYKWKPGDRIYLYAAFKSTYHPSTSLNGDICLTQLDESIEYMAPNVTMAPTFYTLQQENISSDGKKCSFTVRIPKKLIGMNNPTDDLGNSSGKFFLVTSLTPLFRRHSRSDGTPDREFARDENMVSMFCDSIFLPMDASNLNARMPHIAISKELNPASMPASVPMKMHNLGMTFLVDVTYDGSNPSVTDPRLSLSTSFINPITGIYGGNYRKPAERYCHLTKYTAPKYQGRPIATEFNFLHYALLSGKYFIKIFTRDNFFDMLRAQEQENSPNATRKCTINKGKTKRFVAFAFDAKFSGTKDYSVPIRQAKAKDIKILFGRQNVTFNLPEGTRLSRGGVYKLPPVKITDNSIQRR